MGSHGPWTEPEARPPDSRLRWRDCWIVMYVMCTLVDSSGIGFRLAWDTHLLDRPTSDLDHQGHDRPIGFHGGHGRQSRILACSQVRNTGKRFVLDFATWVFPHGWT
jgi:hypothetical protein